MLWQRDSDSPFTTEQGKTMEESGDTFTYAKEAREGFENWYNRNRANFPSFDQATIFTG